jgi:hypothetical protein
MRRGTLMQNSQPTKMIKFNTPEEEEVHNILTTVTNPRLQTLLRRYVQEDRTENSSESVAEIQEILPHVGVKSILKALKFSNYNPVLAMDVLLNGNMKDPRDKINKQIQDLEEAYLQQIGLKDMMKDELLLVRGDGTPTPTGESPKPFDKIAFEAKLIEKRMRDEKLRRNNKFYCKGEREALLKYAGSKENEIIRYKLTRSNIFDADGEEIHFRVIESQLCSRDGSAYNYYGNQGLEIDSVEYIANPMLLQRFEQKRLEFAKKYDMLLESVKPLLLFHGTKVDNLPNITKGNFLIEKLGAHTGNRGA